MKKLLILPLLLLLTSCSINDTMTQKERINKIKQCSDLGVGYRITNNGNVKCDNYKQDKVMDCIREYTNGIDEKYNNPDTVSDLREDDYSQVVKTCNEIFGAK